MNPHEILGVASGATPEEIKSAYRKMAMKHHPDKHGGTEESQKKFQEIQNAYDMLRSDKPRQQQNQPHPNMHNAQDIHNIFEQMFRQHQQMHAAMHAFAEINLLQAYEGCSVTFNLPNDKVVKVDFPKGVHDGQSFHIKGGSDNNSPPMNLQVVVRIIQNDSFGRRGNDLLCKVDIDVIDALVGCDRDIRTLDGETITVTIPPNTTPHSSVNITGKGMPVPNTDQFGNLSVFFNFTYRHFTDDQLEKLRELKKA